MLEGAPRDWAYFDFEDAVPAGKGEWWSVYVVFRREDGGEISRHRIPREGDRVMSIARMYAVRRQYLLRREGRGR